MTTRPPQVHIGMAVFNEGKYLDATLTALREQTFSDFTLLLCDNVSTDETEAIARRHARDDSRIIYRRNETNIGAVANFCQTFDAAESPYFLFASGHDYWKPDFLARCVETLDAHPDAVLAYPGAWWGDPAAPEAGDVYGPQLDTRNMDLETRVPRVAREILGYAIYGLIRTAPFRQIMPPPENLLAPDLLALIHLSLLGEFAFIPETLFCLRHTEDTEHLGRSLQRMAVSFGRRKSLLLPLRYLFEPLRVIRQECPAKGTRRRVSCRVLWNLWRRGHRFLIATVIAGWMPGLINWHLRRQGKTVAIET